MADQLFSYSEGGGWKPAVRIPVGSPVISVKRLQRLCWRAIVQEKQVVVLNGRKFSDYKLAFAYGKWTLAWERQKQIAQQQVKAPRR